MVLPYRLIGALGFVLSTLPARTTMPQVQQFAVWTKDGACLRGIRYDSTGVPAILLHGLAASLKEFDLQTNHTPSLARYLREAGFDVWLWNLRGAGTGDLESLLPDGEGAWCADHYVLEDLPAILSCVRKANRRRPFLIGHSLGGMTIAAYLAGAVERVPGSPEGGVAIDPQAARRRAAEIRGAVLIASPARLAWRPEREPRALVRLAEGALTLNAGAILPDRIRLSMLNRLASREASPVLGNVLEKIREFLEEELEDDDLLARILAGNRERAVRLLERLRAGVLSDCSRDLLLQLARSVKERNWGSYLGKERAVYSDYYGNIGVPILFLAGSEDPLVDPEIIRSSLIDKARAPDALFLEIEGYGHADLVLGSSADEDVFPRLLRWLEGRSAD